MNLQELDKQMQTINFDKKDNKISKNTLERKMKELISKVDIKDLKDLQLSKIFKDKETLIIIENIKKDFIDKIIRYKEVEDLKRKNQLENYDKEIKEIKKSKKPILAVGFVGFIMSMKDPLKEIKEKEKQFKEFIFEDKKMFSKEFNEKNSPLKQKLSKIFKNIFKDENGKNFLQTLKKEDNLKNGIFSINSEDLTPQKMFLENTIKNLLRNENIDLDLFNKDLKNYNLNSLEDNTKLAIAKNNIFNVIKNPSINNISVKNLSGKQINDTIKNFEFLSPEIKETFNNFNKFLRNNEIELERKFGKSKKINHLEIK